MKHATIILLIGIPFASVLMGAVMLYFAVQQPVETSQIDHAPCKNQLASDGGTPAALCTLSVGDMHCAACAGKTKRT